MCSNTWALIKDAIDTWVADQKAAGRTHEQIKADLASYDTWDRNDYDDDGNFNEADGYIDHFQIVHAGGDQADGDPQQGEDAIWSHRWKAFQNLIGTGGPPFNKDGGTPVGTTGLWVADYTIQPENGGLSVFAHEYGHDLGLPDHYDAADRQPRQLVDADGPEPRLRPRGPGHRHAPGGPRRVGQAPARLARLRGRARRHDAHARARPARVQQRQGAGRRRAARQDAPGRDELRQADVRDQAVVVRAGRQLPRRASPAQVTLGAGTSTLKFNAHWNIEDCGPDACDYAYVQVDDGTGFKAIPGSITKAAEGNGIDGISNGWVPATFDLSSFAGKTVKLRLHYRTDRGRAGAGHEAAGGPVRRRHRAHVGRPDACSPTTPSRATTAGRRTASAPSGESSTQLFDHYYVASNREYVSYDKYLQSGPYNFGFPQDRPDWVEHFPYQNGLLVSYWDTSYSDNNTSQHPGEGEILPIDSHPQPIYKLDGKPWRGRIQTYDAPFGLEKADSFTLHDQTTGQASYIRGQAAVPVFDDRRSYWSAAQPFVGVKVPDAGVRMQVQSAVRHLDEGPDQLHEVVRRAHGPGSAPARVRRAARWRVGAP